MFYWKNKKLSLTALVLACIAGICVVAYIGSIPTKSVKLPKSDSAKFLRVNTAPNGKLRNPFPGLNAAQNWFVRNKIKRSDLLNMPLDEAAKRLTQAVYSFCQHGNAPRDLNDLFVKCTAACGGYAYVLRGLLEVIGAETQYVNLYNIPNQGNHTAVEVRIAGDWKFLDPTFGAFFTDDGDPNSPLMSLNEMAYDVTFGNLHNHVNQGPKRAQNVITTPLTDLFSYDFKHPYMKIENYQLAERISGSDDQGMFILDVPLTIRDGIASVGSVDSDLKANRENLWLKHTNKSLGDETHINDVSFVASHLNNTDQLQKLVTISVRRLKPNKRYNLFLFLTGGASDSIIEIGSIGKGILFKRSSNHVFPQNGGIFRESFISLDPTAQFYIRSMGLHSRSRLFGVKIEETD